MRIVLLGAPGCGKGTQGHRLAASYKVPEISAGDLLRGAVAAGTTLGKAAKAVMDAGQLVSDDIVLGVIRERLTLGDTGNGFILDGFPRNAAQAEQLDELLDQLGQPIDLALLIEVDVDVILQRLLGRRTCVSCGASYNIFYAPPRMDDSCDECGGRLKRRSDDNEETIGNRLRIYEIQTLPAIDRYREQGRLRVVQGLGDIDDVFKALSKAIEEVKAAFGNQDRSAAIRRAVVRKQLAQTPEPDKNKKKQSITEAGTKKTGSEAKPAKKIAEKAVSKKATAEKKVAKKPAAKKKVAKKTVKKTASKKTAAKKKVVKKPAAKKKVAKKAVKKKKVSKKTAAKKKVTRKKLRRRQSAGKPSRRNR
jgi:adenylate kinase